MSAVSPPAEMASGRNLGRSSRPTMPRTEAAMLAGNDGSASAEPEEHGHVLEPPVGRCTARGRHGGERARHGPRQRAQRFGGGGGSEGEERGGGESDLHPDFSVCWCVSAASACMAAACSAVFLL